MATNVHYLPHLEIMNVNLVNIIWVFSPQLHSTQIILSFLKLEYCIKTNMV